MTAAVTKRAPRKYQAWCPACKDGVNAGKWFCEEWAHEHNTEKHPQEKDR